MDKRTTPTQLKPCPFCGGMAKAAQWEGHWGWSHPANGCFMQHYDPYDYDTEAEAIAAWNQRPAQEAQPMSAQEAESELVEDFGLYGKYHRALLELLAVIHRDGGHTTQEIGIDLSIKTAMQKSSERIAAADRITRLEAALSKIRAISSRPTYPGNNLRDIDSIARTALGAGE